MDGREAAAEGARVGDQRWGQIEGAQLEVRRTDVERLDDGCPTGTRRVGKPAQPAASHAVAGGAAGPRGTCLWKVLVDRIVAGRGAGREQSLLCPPQGCRLEDPG